MSKGYKGGDFEREVSKKLSLWWSKGLGGKPRDDIFWRSSQSGGRATQRFKKGVRTYGSYGDIAAVDPIGEPLLKLFTIELKRGSSHGSPGDLLDFKADNKCHPWMKCLLQTVRSCIQAGSHGWMMICRRDHRQAMVYIDRDSARSLEACAWFLGCPVVARFDLRCETTRIRFVALPLEDFLARVSPAQIIQCLNTIPTLPDNKRKK
jgi:hypothetical protein